MNDIVGFMLFTASRAGSWQAWRLFVHDERQRFLEWANRKSPICKRWAGRFPSNAATKLRAFSNADRSDANRS